MKEELYINECINAWLMVWERKLHQQHNGKRPKEDRGKMFTALCHSSGIQVMLWLSVVLCTRMTPIWQFQQFSALTSCREICLVTGNYKNHIHNYLVQEWNYKLYIKNTMFHWLIARLHPYDHQKGPLSKAPGALATLQALHCGSPLLPLWRVN